MDQLIQFSHLLLSRPQPKWRRFLAERIDYDARLVGLAGARGAGKTTLVLQHLRTLPPESVLYVSCDHPLMAGWSLLELAQQAAARGIRVLAIDEIHRKQDFALALKNIYDFVPDLQVIFTGSAALHLYQAQADLSRRALLYELPELSFREYLMLRTGMAFESVPLPRLLQDHVAIAREVIEQVRPLQYFDAYLQHGCYPYFLEGESSYLQRLVAVVDQSVREDVALLHGVDADKVEALIKLLQVVCQSKPYEVRYERIAAASQLARNTLKRYLFLLEQASLLRRIGGRIRGDSYIAKPDKLYLHNPNLFQVLCPEPNKGALRESFMAMMLDYDHTLGYPNAGDFMIDEHWIIEVGGPNKGEKQIEGVKNAYVAVVDGLEIGHDRRIPLWLFGFLY